jgi:hypothetical protein
VLPSLDISSSVLLREGLMNGAHKAAMAAGRARRAQHAREAGAMRAALFCEWSLNYAKGKATLRDCPFDPELASDSDFEYAREMGLI